LIRDNISTNFQQYLDYHCISKSQLTRYFSVTEVYSARERNGIYIPRERYFEEEAEKKVGHFYVLGLANCELYVSLHPLIIVS
jgi:hypothetical protein